MSRAAVMETKLASKTRYSIPRRRRTITRSREGGAASAGSRSRSARTTVPSVGAVCLKWVRWITAKESLHIELTLSAVRSPLSLVGREMHRASLLAIPELNRSPATSARPHGGQFYALCVGD